VESIVIDGRSVRRRLTVSDLPVLISVKRPPIRFDWTCRCNTEL
jgi:hypothetical protein